MDGDGCKGLCSTESLSEARPTGKRLHEEAVCGVTAHATRCVSVGGEFRGKFQRGEGA